MTYRLLHLLAIPSFSSVIAKRRSNLFQLEAKHLWFALVVCLGSLALAQPTLTDVTLSQLPSWAGPQFESESFRQRYLFDLSLNPFMQRADFDGDGFLDVAVLAREIETGQRHLLVLLHDDTAPTILSSDKDATPTDLSWLLIWHVEERLPAGANLSPDADILILSSLDGAVLWLFRDAGAWHTY